MRNAIITKICEYCIFFMFTDLPDTDDDKLKFYPIDYNEPERKDMAIIMVYFNATRSVRIAQNILLIKQWLDNANIPYYIGELSINNAPFLFRESDNIFHYTSTDYMFYKENLINLVEDRIPEQYTKLCNLDADVLFDDPDWYARISTHLDNVDICQPFKTAYWLGIEYNHILTRYRNSCFLDNINGHPGFAWAFKRSIFKQRKLPDFCLTGGGDLVFYGTNVLSSYIVPDEHSYMDKILEKYIATISMHDTVKGIVNMNIYHLYHGTIRNRRYYDRDDRMTKMIKSLNVNNIGDIIDYDSNGVRCWKEPYKAPMNAFMKEYLCNRKDDGL